MQVDRAGLEVLDRATCLQLLGGADRGRVAINLGALPTILPVRFMLDVDRVVISVGIGSALESATDGTVVAFQADGVDHEPDEEWSVSVVGTAHHLDTHAGAAAESRLLPRWRPDLPSRLVAITTDRLTGRRTVAPAGRTS